MSPKYIFYSMILAFTMVSGVSAAEWTLDSVTTYEPSSEPAEPSVITQEFLGSVNVPFDPKGGGVEAKGHAMIGAQPWELYGDFDVLDVTLAFQRPGSEFRTLKMVLGRFPMADSTGLILAHPGDGAKVVIDFAGFGLDVAAGYTGFVNRSSSGIDMTLEDSAHSGDLFASRRAIGTAEASLPLILSQQFTLGAVVQYDLNPSSDLISSGTTTQSYTEGGTLNTQYLTLKLSGPVGDRILYDLTGILETGSTLGYVSQVYNYEPILAGLAGADVSYFFPGDSAAVLKARVLAASGDTSATSAIEGCASSQETLFIPITPVTLGVVFSPALSNLLYYEFGGTMKLIPGLEMVSGVKVLGFQRAVNGVVNASGFSGTGPLWLGTEVDASTTWAVVSDCALSVDAGCFFPNGSSTQWAVTATLDLSL